MSLALSAPVTAPDLIKMKREAKRISMLTAYDFPFARIFDEAGIDVLLVGDSLGMVVQGNATTLPVTMDEIVYHTRMVARAAKRALVVADMPFLSYQTGVRDAVLQAGRLMKEAGAHAVKLEGGAQMMEVIQAMTSIGIPVMAHVGLTPQSVHSMGGFKVQGRGDEQAERVREDARKVQEAGAFSVVLEGIPGELAREITTELSIPTIGIGAGVHCDGQVLVAHDFLGISERTPRFVKRYESIGERMRLAAETYASEVRNGSFPGPEHTFGTTSKATPTAPSKASGYGPNEG